MRLTSMKYLKRLVRAVVDRNYIVPTANARVRTWIIRAY